jgi:parallel beta-helix repeat protein
VGFGHHDGKWRTPRFAFGIYLDDNASGVDVVGNIVARSSWANIYLHNGRDNLIENNLLIDGGEQQFRLMSFRSKNRFLPEMSRSYEAYSRLPDWQHFRGFVGVPPESATPMANNAFVRNVIVYGRKMAKYVWHRGLPFSETKFESNVVFSQKTIVSIDPSVLPPAMQWAEWQAMGLDRSSIQADPQLLPRSPPRLAADSVAFRVGFRPIPVDAIGPYASERRASWPIVEPPAIREVLE